MIAALLLGRKGSVGFPGKNLLPVFGRPGESYSKPRTLRLQPLRGKQNATPAQGRMAQTVRMGTL